MRSVLLLAVLLLAVAAAAEDVGPCIEDDSFAVEPRVNGLLITHRDATYNCCPDPITYEVERNGQQILVNERVLPEFPCDCICCFDLEVELTEVPPGVVTVTFNWYDEDEGRIRSESLIATVPGGDATEDLAVLGSQRSDCLPTGADVCRWGAIKAAYRRE